MKGSVILGIVLVGIAVLFAVGSFSYRGMAGFVPLTLAVPTAILAALVLAGEKFPAIIRFFDVSLEDVLASGTGGVDQAVEPEKPRGSEMKLIVAMFLWFIAFVGVLFFAGFYIATGLFSLLFTRFQGGIGWLGAIFMTVLACGFFYIVFQEALGVDLFEGVLFDAQVPPI